MSGEWPHPHRSQKLSAAAAPRQHDPRRVPFRAPSSASIGKSGESHHPLRKIPHREKMPPDAKCKKEIENKINTFCSEKTASYYFDPPKTLPHAAAGNSPVARRLLHRRRLPQKFPPPKLGEPHRRSDPAQFPASSRSGSSKGFGRCKTSFPAENPPIQFRRHSSRPTEEPLAKTKPPAKRGQLNSLPEKIGSLRNPPRAGKARR